MSAFLRAMQQQGIHPYPVTGNHVAMYKEALLDQVQKSASVTCDLFVLLGTFGQFGQNEPVALGKSEGHTGCPIAQSREEHHAKSDRNGGLYPPGLILWEEGITEVDVVIEFENPATTIFIEMKYGSPLSSTTSKNAGDHGFPSDQLIRNIRIGLRRCNWFDENLLVSKAKRDFLVIVLAPFSVPKLVDSYQNPSSIRDAIPNGAQLSQLPAHRFVGGTTYSKLMFELESNVPFMATSEKRLVQQLREYLDFKQSSIAKRLSPTSREVTGTFLPVVSV